MAGTGQSVAGLILAGGESSRMGRPKALLDWGGKALLQHQIDVFREAGCDPLVVVLGHGADELRARIRCLAPCRIVENAAYRSGRASSLRMGAEALGEGAAAVLIAGVDQPCSVETVRRVVEEWRLSRAAIVVPRQGGRNGHPALFAGALLAELRRVEERTEGLRAVRIAYREATRFVDVSDPWVTLNLNRPADYEAACARFFPSG